MLETFENNAREIGAYSDNSGLAEVVGNETLGEHKINMSTPTINIGDTKINDSDLKYTPKSEFINNANVLSIDDILKMGFARAVELLMKLQGEHLEVRKENEQFRQQNTILLCKNHKLGKELEKELSANDDE